METLIHAGLVNALFAAALAVVVAGVTLLFRRRPAVVHGLWVLVLVKFFVPSFYPVEISGWHPAATPVVTPEPVGIQEHPSPGHLEEQIPSPPEDTSPDPIDSDHPPAAMREPAVVEGPETAIPDPTTSSKPSAWQFSWEHVVAIVWLAGSLTWMMVAWIRIVRFRRLLRFALPANREVQFRVQQLAGRLGLSVCPSVSFVAAPIAPLLWGLARSPRLLIPSQLWDRLNENQRDTLLVHELAHLRRGDHWVRRLEMAVLALYWWHPVVWWAQRQLREAEEQCCDAWVLWALPHAAQDYAVALVETLAFLCHSPPALPLGASGIEPMRFLKRRLTMIVQGHTPRAMSRLTLWFIVGLGALLLPLLPVPAQQTANPGSDDEEQVQPPPLPRTPPGPTEAPASIPPPIRVDRAEQIDAARDQVDLMEAKFMIKRAELEEMEMRIRLAQRNVSRLEEVYKTGRLEESAMQKARNETELLPTQLLTKKAELKEAEILLKQAQRRLARLEAGSDFPAGGAPGALEPAGRPTMQPGGPPPMKGPGGLPPVKPGPPRKPGASGSSGKAPPGELPSSGLPGKKPPSLPGPGAAGPAAPALPGSPNAGMETPSDPSLPQGPKGSPPSKPPSDDAEGVILEADVRTGQAIISMGKSSGIKAGSQLEVFRLKPNPKYLGKIEILAAQENRALGRLTDAARFGPLQKGDLVAGKVTDRSSMGEHQAKVDWPDWAGKTVRFEVRDKPWSQVFEWLSDLTGLPVMMSNDSKPTGKFTYFSPNNAPKEYTIPQVIDILNLSLGRQNYLLFRRGENLYVVSTAIANPLGIGGRELDPPWAARLFPEKSWNFGTVQRGEKVIHGFEFINPLKQPIHISGVRTSASFVKAFPIVIVEGGAQARMTEAWISPHQLTTIEVEMDTERFTGDKTAFVYVQIDQPAAAEVRLQVQARSLEAPAGVNDKTEPKARILELENKVDQLMKQIDALRNELKQQPARPATGSSRIEAVPGTQTRH